MKIFFLTKKVVYFGLLFVFLASLQSCGSESLDQSENLTAPPTENSQPSEKTLNYHTAIYNGQVFQYLGDDFYTEKNGLAIVDGDEVIGTVEDVKANAIYVADLSENEELGKLSIGFVGGNSSSNRRWPNATVPYEIDSAFDSTEVGNILSAINQFNAGTLMNVRPRAGDVNYIKFIKSSDLGSGVGGLSSIGYSGVPAQSIWFQPNFDVGGMIHEIGHAVGLYHEHQRADRDSYVAIHLENIISGQESNFSIRSTNVSYYGTPYDYASIMHYPRYAFSSNGNDTIVPLQNVDIGQRNGLSAGDINGIRGIYFSDLDSDGVIDASDNCPARFNPGQEDWDHDGKGNICDLDWLPPSIFLALE